MLMHPDDTGDVRACGGEGTSPAAAPARTGRAGGERRLERRATTPRRNFETRRSPGRPAHVSFQTPSLNASDAGTIEKREYQKAWGGVQAAAIAASLRSGIHRLHDQKTTLAHLPVQLCTPRFLVLPLLGRRRGVSGRRSRQQLETSTKITCLSGRHPTVRRSA